MKSTHSNGGHLIECLLVARPDAESALFRQHEDKSVTAYLDRYAVIPLELFEAMGGTDNPAYLSYITAHGVSSVDSATVPVG